MRDGSGFRWIIGRVIGWIGIVVTPWSEVTAITTEFTVSRPDMIWECQPVVQFHR